MKSSRHATKATAARLCKIIGRPAKPPHSRRRFAEICFRLLHKFVLCPKPESLKPARLGDAAPAQLPLPSRAQSKRSTTVPSICLSEALSTGTKLFGQVLTACKAGDAPLDDRRLSSEFKWWDQLALTRRGVREPVGRWRCKHSAPDS